jgi:uncharacterized protein (TIGR02266 family)
MAEASSTEEGITLRIRFKSETLEKFAERYAADIGPGEIFVRTREPLGVGTPLNFDFTLHDGSPLLAGRGSVAWTREPDLSRPEPSGMGIRFDNLTPIGQQMLGRILEFKARSADAGGLADLARSAPTPMNAIATTTSTTTSSSRSGRTGEAEHQRATTPYRTVAPDDPAAAMAAAGSIVKLNRAGQTSPGMGGVSTKDFAASGDDAERTEIARMPPSFYYDAADDEANRKAEQARAQRARQAQEEARVEEVAAEDLLEEGGEDDGGQGQGAGPLDDLDDITSPRAELPVHTLPIGPDLTVPWKPPAAPVAGSLAASLRPPLGVTSPGRAGNDVAGRPREHRETLGFGSAAPTPVPADAGPVALRPTRARMDALAPGIGEGTTPRPDSGPMHGLPRGQGVDSVVGGPSAGASLPAWTGEPEVHQPRPQRAGTGRGWLVTAVGAAAVIGLGLWLVPRFMAPAPVPPTDSPAPAAEGTPAPSDPAASPPAAGPTATDPGAGSGAIAQGDKTGDNAAAAPGAAGTPPAGGAARPGQPDMAVKPPTMAATPPAPAAAAPAAAAPAAARPVRRIRNVRPRRPPVAVAPTGDPALDPALPAPAAADPTAPAGAVPAPGSPLATAPAGAQVPAAGEEEVYWLSVKSVPAGADVLIDGQVEGKTPFQRRIFDPNRTYALSIRKPGFETVERSLTAADQWLKRGNLRHLTINARLMSSSTAEPSTAFTEPGTNLRAPPAAEPSASAPSTPPPAAPPPERKTNPFDEPPPSPAPAPTP